LDEERMDKPRLVSRSVLEDKKYLNNVQQKWSVSATATKMVPVPNICQQKTNQQKSPVRSSENFACMKNKKLKEEKFICSHFLKIILVAKTFNTHITA
jgi:hypothetical protein